MNNLWTALRMFLWMTFLTGVAYPFLITGIAQLTMKHKADGGFITSKGKIVGATLIAQKFESPKYFWPRPSAIDYNPLPSGGSNLGPTSAALKKAVADRKAIIMKAHGVTDASKIPSELLFASGSGLDPHISPQTAFFQVERIVKSRNLDMNKGKKTVIHLIDKLTEHRFLGFIGQPCVNVLKLNLALDELETSQK